MAKKEKYICRRCSHEFIAIPGAEEAPDCPECESSEVEKLERATYGDTSEDLDFTPKRSRFS